VSRSTTNTRARYRSPDVAPVALRTRRHHVFCGATGDQLDFGDENQRRIKWAGKPAEAQTVLLGTPRASLGKTEEVPQRRDPSRTLPRVLTEAGRGVVSGLVSITWRGFTERDHAVNIIPAGTGFRLTIAKVPKAMVVELLDEPRPAQPSTPAPENPDIG